MGNWLGQLAILIVILAVLRFVFGLPISIVGSVVLTVVLSLAFMAFARR